MQPGGGRGHRSALAGEDRLVAFAVGGGVGALDVGRQRDVADLLELGEQIARARKAQGALAEFPARHDLGFQAAAESDALADRQLAAGTHERLPIAPVGAGGAQEKDLHLAAQIFVPLGIVPADGQRAHARAMAEQARRKNARIVEHQAIAGAQELRETRETGGLPSGPPAR